MFEEIEAVLDSVGMGMLDVVRTWFFLDEILRWYDDFNKVRTHFFNARRVFKGLVPASTGVGTKNPRGAAVIAAARAFQGSPEHLSGYEVGSPLQCSATDYGSSFSRAVELRMTGCRQVIVSGTASIDADGLSVCQGDAESQIDLSMEVVRAILNSCNMDFGDASRITGYFKFPQDASLFKAWQSRHGLQNWPAVCAQAEICRDELLFEIELDAIKEN
jgi:enamine deaminase RidA (YjgF/YER057c/UK114 family)